MNDNGKERHYEYDKRGYLTRTQYADGSTEIRVPDNTGNLYETLNKSDRKYGKGGQLIKTERWEYKYDDLGNLIRKKDKHGQTWRYEWNDAGMLSKVKRPDSVEVTFKYDALGRRIEKCFNNRTYTKWIWDGNVPLHEWRETHTKDYEPEEGYFTRIEKQPVTTWVFEEGTFVPAAKLTESKKLSIVANYMGTPEAMYDDEGRKSWSCELNSYGRVRSFEGEYKTDCPFRYQGQYEDSETGLYYNRFRYYSPEEGIYISQDPAGLQVNMNLYSFSLNTNLWLDPFGLAWTYYQLKDASGNVVYHGITERPVQERLQEHARDGKTFDQVTYVDNLPDRVAARDMEGSALHHDRGKKLQNADRPVSEGYYHSYDPDNIKDGRTFLSEVEIEQKMNKDGKTSDVDKKGKLCA